MDEFGLQHVTQHRFNLAARTTLDQLRLRAAVVRQPARDLAPRRAQARDHLAARERALHADYADWQQTLAAFCELFDSAVVDHDMPAHLKMIGHPLLARS